MTIGYDHLSDECNYLVWRRKRNEDKKQTKRNGAEKKSKHQTRKTKRYMTYRLKCENHQPLTKT